MLLLNVARGNHYSKKKRKKAAAAQNACHARRGSLACRLTLNRGVAAHLQLCDSIAGDFGGQQLSLSIPAAIASDGLLIKYLSLLASDCVEIFIQRTRARALFSLE